MSGKRGRHPKKAGGRATPKGTQPERARLGAGPRHLRQRGRSRARRSRRRRSVSRRRFSRSSVEGGLPPRSLASTRRGAARSVARRWPGRPLRRQLDPCRSARPGVRPCRARLRQADRQDTTAALVGRDGQRRQSARSRCCATNTATGSVCTSNTTTPRRARERSACTSTPTWAASSRTSSTGHRSPWSVSWPRPSHRSRSSPSTRPRRVRGSRPPSRCSTRTTTSSSPTTSTTFVRWPSSGSRCCPVAARCPTKARAVRRRARRARRGLRQQPPLHRPARRGPRDRRDHLRVRGRRAMATRCAGAPSSSRSS